MRRGGNFCNDYGDQVGCLGEVDERYTMRFDDLGEPPIFWCAFCGPKAHNLSKAIDTAFQTRGYAFLEEFAGLIQQAESQKERQ